MLRVVVEPQRPARKDQPEPGVDLVRAARHLHGGQLRKLARPQRSRSTFVRTTVVLTALLLIVPDLVVDVSSGSRLVLVLTHLIAAAIIIPTLATRLPQDA